jgi:hypothetical protein
MDEWKEDEPKPIPTHPSSTSFDTIHSHGDWCGVPGNCGFLPSFLPSLCPFQFISFFGGFKLAIWSSILRPIFSTTSFHLAIFSHFLRYYFLHFPSTKKDKCKICLRIILTDSLIFLDKKFRVYLNLKAQ